MADAEGVISELKNQHALDRARCRGTPLFHLQLLLGCTAINMKRLTSHTGEADTGRAAGPTSGETITLDAVGSATQASLGARVAPRGAPSRHQSGARHARTAIWFLSVSLN